MKVHDEDMLNAALIGYGQQLKNINAKMEDIRRQLSGRKSNGAAPIGPAVRKTHLISPEGLERIREAQKRRWADARKKKKAAAA